MVFLNQVLPTGIIQICGFAISGLAQSNKLSDLQYAAYGKSKNITE
jgi:hypothetical protein